jgi:hypothetical protein
MVPGNPEISTASSEINAKFEGVCGYDPHHRAFSQFPFYGPSFLRQETGAVRGDRVREPGRGSSRVLPGPHRYQLGHLPGTGETEALEIVLHTGDEQILGLLVR